ncbi:MAG: hypothetical protein [Lokiarchaeia virus VerdaV1]|uniref:Uncharacterized protein n=1 Tax=Lokiarchaeia virus VerdaV1 TaxID=3070170 RepID=A0AA35CNB5_9CAUD|nr:MAG: hypothetical protein QIT41_gp06 [Lokiarchaeia virus VerdaV1]BDI54855.1 MAG: hypothetical protein [Lokiarchaeia virus VerdaV1]
MTDSGLELFDSYYGGGFLGVMKEHYEFDLDTDITEGKYGDVVTDGYCAVMIVDPTENLYPGTPLYPSVTKGKMGYTPSINLEPIATLKSTIVSGDDVAIVKLLR